MVEVVIFMLRSTNDQIVPSRVSKEPNLGEDVVNACGILVLAKVPQKEISFNAN